MKTKIKANFQPWIGELYETEGFNGKRILALGDSHYCGECELCKNNSISVDNILTQCPYYAKGGLTNHVFNDFYIGEKENYGSWKSTFLKFVRSLEGNKKVTHDESIDTFQKICFYNFVQTAYNDEPSACYAPEDYETSMPMFREVLAALSPDLVIVWGITVWNFLKEEKKLDEIKAGYGYLRGNTPLFVKIIHPAARGFAYKRTIPVLKEALDAVENIK